MYPMYPYTELAESRRRDFERRAAAHRLAASIPRRRRQYGAMLLNTLDRVFHHTSPRPRVMTTHRTARLRSGGSGSVFPPGHCESAC